MKLHLLLAAAIAFSGVALSASLGATPGLSQSLDPTLDEINRPQGRIDPNRPIKIEVINAGGAAVTCVLTQPASAERRLAPGTRTAFGSLTTSYLPLPINMLTYPSETDIGISSDVVVSGNTITVIVGQQLAVATGDIALNVDSDGYIYVY